MKRKKAIKKKKEQVAKLDIDILDKMNQFINYATDLKKSKKKPNPFQVVAKTLASALEIKFMFQQRQIIESQPIPPKKETYWFCMESQKIEKDNGKSLGWWCKLGELTPERAKTIRKLLKTTWISQSDMLKIVKGGDVKNPCVLGEENTERILNKPPCIQEGIFHHLMKMETETWKDTHKLRHNVVPNYEYRLQSKWVNDVGDVEWRDIPKKQ